MTTNTINRPKAASDAFDTQVRTIDTNVLTYFDPNLKLPIGPVPETAQAFKAELDGYVSLCDAETVAGTNTTNAKGKKVAAATALKPKLKAFHLIALAAYETNPEVLAKLSFTAPKTPRKLTAEEKVAAFNKRKQKTAARKAAADALAAALAAIDAGTPAATSAVSTPTAAAPPPASAAPSTNGHS